jgi:hypothetical protein
MTWHDGPPPSEVTDGSLAVVILKRGIALEHYGDPVIVHQYGYKLKTTVEPTRIEYEDVLKWAELPEWMKDKN